jgi:hypothetical protein
MSEHTSDGKFYAVRQFRGGKVLGSRIMTEAEAQREVAAWRLAVGRAAVVADAADVREAVHSDDQTVLSKLLNDNEPHVWISTTSHRSRDRLRQVFRSAADEYGPGPEFGSWPKGGTPRGCYYLVNARHLPAIERIAGIRVLQAEPRDLFKRWGQDETGELGVRLGHGAKVSS